MLQDESLLETFLSEDEDDIEKKRSKKYHIARLTVKHLRDLADKYLEMGIPVPFASQFSRTALNIEKVMFE